MNPQRRSSRLLLPGFTLVELMVSVSIIGLIMVVLLGMTNQISNTWRATTGKIEEFQQARNGFESMTRKISQATLNTFWDINFQVVSSTHQPTSFRRNSQLRFACGPMGNAGTGFAGLMGSAPAAPAGHSYVTHGVFFQAPFGYVDQPGVQDMSNLLNTWGFYVDFSNDASSDPPFITGMPQAYPALWRFRLTEYQEPTEYMSVYNWDANRHDYSSSVPSGTQLGWFQGGMASGVPQPNGGTSPPTRILAQNIIALIIWPKLSKQDEEFRRTQGWSTISPWYLYDSSCLVPGMTTQPASNVFINQGAHVSNVTNAAEAGGINPKNQLPPILQVTMVALDDQSAKRLVDQQGHSLLPTFDAFTTGLFQRAVGSSGVMPSPGTPTQYDSDLGPATTAGTLEYRLTHPATIAPALGVGPLKYRIFTTNVMIRSAKWSSYETN